MYSYNWDPSTGGLLLNSSPLNFSKEPRPVYYKELDILGFDKYWNYEKNDAFPYMWQTVVAVIITMVGGTFVIIVLSENISEKGLAGTSAIILVNILTTFMNNLFSYITAFPSHQPYRL